MIDASRPLVLGHRGSPYSAPENTIRSFLAAIDEGADGVELDVQMSRDGELVIVHDTVADGRPVHQLDRAALADVLGHAVPTLDEVFAALPREAVVYVEFKRQGSLVELDAHERITAMVRERGLPRTFVASFDGWFLRACGQVAPEVPRVLIVDERMLSGDGPLPGWVDGVSLHHALLERLPVEGLWTAAWPADELADLRRCVGAWPRVRAIVTKHPARAVALL